MVFVVHRSSSPSTFCSPPVHRLSTLACLPACPVGCRSYGEWVFTGRMCRLGLYRSVPPHPLGPPIHHPPRAAVILPFFFSLTPSCPFQRPTAEVHYRAGKQRNARRLQKATLAMSIFNEHFSLRRPVRQSPQRRDRGRPAGKVASQSRHPTVRATPPSLLLNPSKSL